MNERLKFCTDPEPLVPPPFWYRSYLTRNLAKTDLGQKNGHATVPIFPGFLDICSRIWEGEEMILFILLFTTSVQNFSLHSIKFSSKSWNTKIRFSSMTRKLYMYRFSWISRELRSILKRVKFHLLCISITTSVILSGLIRKIQFLYDLYQHSCYFSTGNRTTSNSTVLSWSVRVRCWNFAKMLHMPIRAKIPLPPGISGVNSRNPE